MEEKEQPLVVPTENEVMDKLKEFFEKVTPDLTSVAAGIPTNAYLKVLTLNPGITKVRVYLYLEGQDVDNYDLISLGKTIKINFGFTKDQFDLSNPKTPEPSEPNTEA